MTVETRPWLRFYGDVPESLEYPAIRVDEVVARTADRLPDAVAYDFLGSTATYAELTDAMHCRCRSGSASGRRAGGRLRPCPPMRASSGGTTS